jgi:hypothetical protein
MSYFFGIKDGVKLHPTLAMSAMMNAVASVFQYLRTELVITSGIEGQHGAESLHYSGRAVDLRTRHLNESQIVFVVEKLNELLNADFDVVRESDHLHIEYDPKE